MKSLLIHESMTWQFFLFLDHIKNLKEKYISTYQLELDEELSEFVNKYINEKRYEVTFQHKNSTIVAEKEDKIIAFVLEKGIGEITLVTNSKDIEDDFRKYVERYVCGRRFIDVTFFSKVRGDIIDTSLALDVKNIKDTLDFNLFELAGVNVERLTKEFIESQDTLLLLTGEPGIGKSKLAMSIAYHVIAQLNKPMEIVIVKLGRSIIKLQERPDLFHDYRGKIFIFDDIDLPSLDRNCADDEVSSFINFMLSITEGTIPTKNKFIITTNQEINSIDKAFLRPGRLFANIELQRISYKDLRSYNRKVAEKCKEIYNKEEYTIAEVSHIMNLIKRKQRYSFVTKDNVIRQNLVRNTGFSI